MWKLLIVDDEPIIRNGLKKSLPWAEQGIEIVGEAEDGEEALELALLLKPDLMLVDICMPFMDGLQLASQLDKQLPGCKVIVITGFNEFAFAQQAVRAGVFDYLLKPVNLQELQDVVEKAVDALQNEERQANYVGWMSEKLGQSATLLRDEFLRKWFGGMLSAEEVERELKFFHLPFQTEIGLLLIKPLDRSLLQRTHQVWDEQLLHFSISNIVSELLRGLQPHVIWSMDAQTLVVMAECKDQNMWLGLGNELEQKLLECFDMELLTCQQVLEAGIMQAVQVYQELSLKLESSRRLTPVVLAAKKYIEMNYHQEELSLLEVATHTKANPTYLSKMLKKELGMSFIDYVTDIRIRQAIQLMNKPETKLSEISEQVGYSTQHYFSNTFKKVMGISPLSYRKSRGFHV